ncbi:hypothetical protein K435DRAFT_876669 [Dendrothele bispora CBS 962.96]|uniref:Uncharacterized protein n=1 Tax=Dendrothele bispora (strain CBS 962.96) TaxID=1314807 RepID=A0A4S8KRL9_DENBC|nr:hypothetical protein K435DRAFT_876669 [Dendrothele bispora CBS 962.96]
MVIVDLPSPRLNNVSFFSFRRVHNNNFRSHQEGRVVEAKLEVTVEEDDDRTTTNNLKSESLTHLNVLSSSDSVRFIRINKRQRHPSNQPRSSVSWELDSKEGFLILRHDVPLHPILGSSLHYSFRSSGLNINSSSSEPGSSSSMFPVMSTAPGGRGGELGAVSSQTQSLARKRSDSVSVERGKRRKKLVTTGEEECHSTSSTIPSTTSTPFFSAAETLLTFEDQSEFHFESEVGRFSKPKFCIDKDEECDAIDW